MRRPLFAAIGLLAIGALSAASPAPALAAAPDSVDVVASAPGGVGIRLFDIPAATQLDPRARAYIVDNVAPGTTIRRRILVQNNTDQPQNVHVYAAAARIQDESFVGENAASQNELSRWISTGQTQLAVAPHKSVVDLITVAVPADAAEGERYAAVWAEVRSTPSLANNKQVITVSRVGVRVYLSVAAGNGPPSAFTVGSLTARTNSSGSPEILAAVENTGGRAIDLSGTLKLAHGPGGLSAGPFSTQRVTTLLPGSHGNVVILLHKGVPRGPWDVTVALGSGLLRHEATARVTFAAAGAAVVASQPNGVLTLLIMIVVVLLIIAATIALVSLGRARETTRAHRGENEGHAVGDKARWWSRLGQARFPDAGRADLDAVRDQASRPRPRLCPVCGYRMDAHEIKPGHGVVATRINCPNGRSYTVADEHLS